MGYKRLMKAEAFIAGRLEVEDEALFRYLDADGDHEARGKIPVAVAAEIAAALSRLSVIWSDIKAGVRE
jgi:hypothetical protein